MRHMLRTIPSVILLWAGLAGMLTGPAAGQEKKWKSYVRGPGGTHTRGNQVDVTPRNFVFDPQGGTGTLTVTAPATLGWEVKILDPAGASVAWIQSNVINGTGSGIVTFSVNPNPGPPRTALLVIGDQTSFVEQMSGCAVTLSETSLEVPPAGAENLPVTVYGSGSCGWTAVSSDPWLKIRKTAGGSKAAKGDGGSGLLDAGDESIVTGQETEVIHLTAEASEEFSRTGSVTVTSDDPDIEPRVLTILQEDTVLSCLGYLGSPGNPLTEKKFDKNIETHGRIIVRTNKPNCQWRLDYSEVVHWFNFHNAAGTGSIDPADYDELLTGGYWVEPNSTGMPRAGNIYLEVFVDDHWERQRSFRVSQDADCRMHTDDIINLFPMEGVASGSVSFDTHPDYQWEFSINYSSHPSGEGWIVITSHTPDAGGNYHVTGPATITFQILPHPGGPERQANLATSCAGELDKPLRFGRAFFIQEANCGFTFWKSQDPQDDRLSLPATGGTASVELQTATGCGWTALVDARIPDGSSWLHLTEGVSGWGSGIIQFSADPNTTPLDRAGTIHVGGSIFTVHQPSPCNISLYVPDRWSDARAYTNTITVTGAASCYWTAVSNAEWITVTEGAEGSGDREVIYHVSYNDGPARTGTLTVAGRTVTITQSGICPLALGAQNATHGGMPATGVIPVEGEGDCEWIASSDSGWLHITAGASGTANGQVEYSLDANLNGEERTGYITVRSKWYNYKQQEFTVVQRSCSFDLSPGSRSVAAEGGTGFFHVDTTSLCSWNASSTADWLIITSGAGGTGDGNIYFNALPNQHEPPRAAKIRLEGVPGAEVSVSQASSCSYAVSPLAFYPPAGGGAYTIDVEASPGCRWAAATGIPGCTILCGAAGTGPGTVEVLVPPNTGAGRQFVVTIANQNVYFHQAACLPAGLTPAMQTFEGAGGNGEFTIDAPADYNWEAVPSAGWITLTGPATGTGDATVYYQVDANPGNNRAGFITAGGRQIRIEQYRTSPYSFILHSNGASQPAGGGGGSFSVNTPSSINWEAVSQAEWITITSGATGTGSRTVTYQVAPNSGTARTGTIAADLQVFTIQQAAPCPSCALAGNPVLPAEGGSGEILITAEAGCAWTASPSAGWLTLASAGGSGSARLAFTASANPSMSRSCTVQINDIQVEISQLSSCTWSLTPAGAGFGPAAASGTVTVAAGPLCTWEAAASDSWIILAPPAAGQGNGIINYSISENSGPARTGTITTGGQVFTIEQAACGYTLTPGSASFTKDGGTGSFTVSTDDICPWTAIPSAAWITVTAGAGGTGNGTVQYTVASTNGPARTGTITVGNSLFTISMASGCSYSVSQPALQVNKEYNSYWVSLITAAGCPWTAESAVDWIHINGINQAGTGAKDIHFTVDNNGGPQRTGTFTVGGQTVTVTQEDGCYYSRSNLTGLEQPAGGGTGTVKITTNNALCPWTAASNASWLTITGGASGTGTGWVYFTAAANTGPARTGTMTIAGYTVTVSQADGCTYSLNKTTVSKPAAAGSGGFILTCGEDCPWTVTSSAAWLTVTTGTSGTGTKGFTFDLAANTGPARSATLTVAGLVLTVNQSDGCVYSISPASAAIPTSGGTGTVAVTAGEGCTWTASSNAAWLTITAGASGSGNGTVNYSVEANPGPARTGTLTIAGQTFTVSQDDGCVISISPVSRSVIKSGGTGTITVTAGAGCPWDAVSNAAWITITSGSTGTGNGTVNYTVAANTTPGRSGTITIGGQVCTISQSNGCTYTADQTSINVPAAGQNVSIVLTAGAGCTWTAYTVQTWLTITAGASGTGNGTIQVTVSPNNGPQRSGLITINGIENGEQCSISQADGCTYSISPASASLPAAGGSAGFNVTANAFCHWSAYKTASWLTITAGASGICNGTVSYTAAANPGPARSATITVQGQVHTVNQADGCTYAVSPASAGLPAAGGSGSVSVTPSGACPWTASSSQPWLTITAGASGTGNGTVNYSATANTGPARGATITVNGQVHTVNQSDGCTYSLNKTSISKPAEGGSGSFTLTCNEGCSWTATSSAAWLTITSATSGTGPASFTFTMSANTGPVRNASITVAGVVLPASQPSGCVYTISPASSTAPVAGGTGSFSLTTTSGCPWTTVCSDTWLSVTNGTSGTGNKTINYSAAANTGPARSATITVGGQVFTVSQAANCTYTLSPTACNSPVAGHTGSFTVNAATGCTWSVTYQSDFVTINSGGSGNGNGTVNFTVAAHTGPAPRTGYIRVQSNIWYQINQAGNCTATFSPSSISAPASGGWYYIDVTNAEDCTWNADADPWITVYNADPGHGNGVLTVYIAAHTGSARSGEITILGRTIPVTQAASAPPPGPPPAPPPEPAPPPQPPEPSASSTPVLRHDAEAPPAPCPASQPPAELPAPPAGLSGHADRQTPARAAAGPGGAR